MANGIFDRLTGDYRAADPYDQGMISAALAGGRPDPQLDLIRQILHGIRGRKAMPEGQRGPADPMAALGILDPSQQQAPGPELPIGPRRQSAVSGMMPGLGEMPAPQRDSGPPFLRGAPLPGGMDDTRFRGPTGQMAPEVDLGGAVLPGAADTRLFREPPQAAPQGGAGEMDPQRRLELMKAARMFREAGSEFRNITGPSEMLLRGGNVPDRRVVADDLRDDEERVRRGDFENPNSPASIGARQMLADATGQKVPDGMSAAVIMALNPMFDRLIRAEYAGLSAAIARSREGRAQRAEERDFGDIGAAQTGDFSRLPKEARMSLEKAREGFLSNSRVNDLKTQIQAAESIESRLKSSPSYGATSAFRALARASGERGVMTEKDIRDFAERMGWKGIYDRVAKFAGAELPDELKAEIIKLANTLRDDSQKALDAEIATRTGGLRQQYPYLTDEMLRGYFVPGSSPGAPSGAGGRAPGVGQGGGRAGQVRVTIRGEEGWIWMDRAEAQEAARKGWVETHDA